MKKTLKLMLIFIIGIAIVGCSGGKKELSAEDVDAELTGKYEIKNDIMSTTNALLRVNINFDDGDNVVTYSGITQALSYSNPDIEEVDAMIPLYNSKDKYKVLDKQSDHDIKILEDFIASINEEITTEQFITWCLDKGEEEVKKHEDTLSNIPDSNAIIGKIEAKGYKVEKNATGGTTITDDNQILIIKNNVIAVYDLNYDFDGGNGFLYLPQNDGASKQANNKSTFIYQFSSNSFIQGTGTQEEYIAVHALKLWYDTFLTTCGVTQLELATLK